MRFPLMRISVVTAIFGLLLMPAFGATFTTLHSFTGTDGNDVFGGLVQGLDGNFYGTARDGGTFNAGTVYKITPTGILTVLHSFDDTDGSSPWDSLTLGSDDNFYGTTFSGGSPSAGTVFKITPNGVLTTLHSFGAMGDGLAPVANLVQGSDGSFYGTTNAGGTIPNESINNLPEGTVFKITSNGVLTTIYTFSGLDGFQPLSGLVQANDGNFYGTTLGGGAFSNGAIYKITSSGDFTLLYSFSGPDGSFPRPVLVQTSDGNFYGTTQLGGASSDGTVFKITPAGVLTTLRSSPVRMERSLPAVSSSATMGISMGRPRVVARQGLARFIQLRRMAF